VASLLSGADSDRAQSLLAQRFPILHGRLVPLAHRLRRYRTVYYRLVPAEEPTPWDG
jgi:hypothetical protein